LATNTTAQRKVLANIPWTPLALFAALVIVTFLISPNFFQIANISNVLRQSAIVGVIAVGMTFVILTAGIDLSVGSTVGLTAIAAALLINQGLPIPLVVLILLLIGAAVGAINGFVIAVLGIQPFIATLATLVAIRGLGLRITDGAPQQFIGQGFLFEFFGGGGIGPIPGPLIVFAILAIIGWCVLRYLPFGRYIYAVGGSREAARLSGVKTRRVILMAYVISGMCAAVAGWMTAARLSTAEPTAGTLLELDAITAVVIGGTSLMGGVGGIGGTVAGALLLAVIANVMNLMGISPFDQQIVRGLVIIVAVIITSTAIVSRIRRGTTRRSSGAGERNPGAA
jgi:ribose transport system permease protein